jgi:hypothetical protein
MAASFASVASSAASPRLSPSPDGLSTDALSTDALSTDASPGLDLLPPPQLTTTTARQTTQVVRRRVTQRSYSVYGVGEVTPACPTDGSASID